MDEIIDRLYRIELAADESLDTLNEKKRQLKNKYDDFRKDYQKEAEKKFTNETAQLKEHYEQEKNQELKVIEENYEENLKKIRDVPDNPKARRKQYEKVTFYNNLLKKIMFFQVVPENEGIKRKIKVILQKLNHAIYPLYFFMPYLYKKRDRYMKMYNDIDTIHSADLSYLYHKDYEDYSKKIFKKTDLKDTEAIQFESDTFNIPKNYDEILTQVYGDYMTLPPESE